MPKYVITVSDNQAEEIDTAAKKEELSSSDWIVKALPITQELKVNVIDIVVQTAFAPMGEFTIPKLFAEKSWKEFTVGSRLVASKAFFQLVKDKKVDDVVFRRKTSGNTAVYEKIKQVW